MSGGGGKRIRELASESELSSNKATTESGSRFGICKFNLSSPGRSKDRPSHRQICARLVHPLAGSDRSAGPREPLGAIKPPPPPPPPLKSNLLPKPASGLAAASGLALS